MEHDFESLTGYNKLQVTKRSKDLNVWIKDNSLCDIWRILHPKDRDLTHYSLTHKVHSRLDFFLLNTKDKFSIKECSVGASDISDHNTVYLTMQISNILEDTQWRLNIGTLHKEEIIRSM